MTSRQFAKRIARMLFRVLAAPHVLFYRLSARLHDPDKAFHGASQSLARFSGLFGEFLRYEFYRATLEECGEECCISFGTIFSNRHARLGSRVYIGTGCTLGLVTIGDDALLASNVDVLSGSGQHVFDSDRIPIREQGGVLKRVIVGADAWIGNRTVVMADVGPGAVVGAGSVVTKPIPSLALAVGAPARVVGRRGHSHELRQEGRDARSTEDTGA